MNDYETRTSTILEALKRYGWSKTNAAKSNKTMRIYFEKLTDDIEMLSAILTVNKSANGNRAMWEFSRNDDGWAVSAEISNDELLLFSELGSAMEESK